MSTTVTTDRRSAPSPTPLEWAQAYRTAWNDHDGPAVGNVFAPGGTYVDPTLPGPLPDAAIAGYVAGLVAAFPDLHFAVDRVTTDGDQVVVQWRMQGTNSGPLPGAPEPTGGTCDLSGVDVIVVSPEGITSVVGYFDQKTFVEQLGLQTLVLPSDEGPIHFGMSVRTELGNTALPGAITMTWTEVDSDEQEGEFQQRGTSIVEGFAAEPGFIGFVGTFADRRGHTFGAWTSPEAAESAVARSRAHQEGMERVRHGGLGVRGFTSLWRPYRLNQQLNKCHTCRNKVYITHGDSAATCPCGGEVTVASYF